MILFFAPWVPVFGFVPNVLPFPVFEWYCLSYSVAGNYSSIQYWHDAVLIIYVQIHTLPRRNEQAELCTQASGASV